MRTSLQPTIGVALAAWLALVANMNGQPPSRDKESARHGAAMTRHALGTFEVTVKPLPPEGKSGDSSLGRMSLEKHIAGDLEGTSKGEMLTSGSPAKGSASYVALERVTGKLAGRAGSFVLQHSGSMARGSRHLTITVVPDSGTEQLSGLTGKMSIDIKDGKHYYDFEYSLPERP